MDKPNLEKDLLNSDIVRNLVQSSEVFAQNLYCALCNIRWFKEGSDEEWSCSWRFAGGLVASIKAEGGDYMDYYCSGIGTNSNEYSSEGKVSVTVQNALKILGWTWKEYDKLS